MSPFSGSAVTSCRLGRRDAHRAMDLVRSFTLEPTGLLTCRNDIPDCLPGEDAALTPCRRQKASASRIRLVPGWMAPLAPRLAPPTLAGRRPMPFPRRRPLSGQVPLATFPSTSTSAAIPHRPHGSMERACARRRARARPSFALPAWFKGPVLRGPRRRLIARLFKAHDGSSSADSPDLTGRRGAECLLDRDSNLAVAIGRA